MKTDKPLGYAERWMRDGMSILQPAFSVLQVTVDLSAGLQKLESLKQEGVLATPTHLLVQATARALNDNPDLHQIVAGNCRHYPARVDIGVSISGETFVDPVLVVEGADKKSIKELVDEVARRAPEARKANQQMMRVLGRWGRLVPFGFLRRMILRLLFSSVEFRKKGVGTFQVSTMPGDWGLGSKFTTAGLLVGGQAKLRAIAIDNKPEVRLTMNLTLSVDHGVWDGRAAARFLSAVKSHLET